MSKQQLTKAEALTKINENLYPELKDETFYTLCDKLKEEQEAKKKSEARIKQLREPLEQLIGDADELYVDDQLMITWKHDKSSQVFDTKTCG